MTRRTGSCSAPCKVGLRAGEYDLALSTGDAAPIRASRVIVPPGNSTLVGHYTSRAGVRTGAKLAALLGLAAGLTLTIHEGMEQEVCSGSGEDRECREEMNVTELLVGLAAMVGLPLVALPFALWGDSASVEIVPGLAPAALGSRERVPASGDWSGATLRVRF